VNVIGKETTPLRTRRRLAALTVDYETWQPIPPGRTIDWDADIFAPAARLAAIGEACGVSVTFFVEMGEYFWLCANDTDVARRMEDQWRDLALRGHDLQLHLHPSWLPELGAEKTQDGWFWNWNLSKADDYPGDLSATIRRCKDALESVVRQVDPAYRVTCFRAGAYQAQPFERLYDALVDNDIVCDSSVYQGGHSEERGYDYRSARSSHQPYFASRVDPQFESSDSQRLVELPVFTYSPDTRAFIDGSEGPRFADAFLAYLRRTRGAGRRAPRVFDRLPYSLRTLLTPQRDSRDDAADYFVLIGHTKADLDDAAILDGVRRLQRLAGVEFVAMSSLADHALTDLRSPAQAAARAAVSPQSSGWQRRIPLDRSAILVLGAAAGERAQSLAAAMPWATVHAERGPAHAGPTLRAGAFDCIYSECDLEFDGAEGCRHLKRLLSDGGVLILNRPVSAAVATLEPRLRAAGFSGIETHRSSSRGRVDIRCWAIDGGYTASGRARRAMTWLYQRVSPERSHPAWRVGDILRDGHAYCAGYASALGQILRHDGYRVRWLSMEARGHVRGRGADGNEHHEVISAVIDGAWVILDPMTNTLIPHDLTSVLARPDLATAKAAADERYDTRGYQYYDTRYWYSRVVRYSYRISPRTPPFIWKRNRSALLTSTRLEQASPAMRVGD
jgi:Transglutaminase-like superfamily